MQCSNLDDQMCNAAIGTPIQIWIKLDGPRSIPDKLRGIAQNNLAMLTQKSFLHLFCHAKAPNDGLESYSLPKIIHSSCIDLNSSILMTMQRQIHLPTLDRLSIARSQNHACSGQEPLS